MCVSPILLILQWCLLGCLWLQHLLYQVFCPVVLMAKEKAPVVSFKGEKKKGKENKILIYMFSHLIIYFMFVVSLGQIFHLHSFKNHFWDFTHAVINNAFLVLMSNGWVWENLVKVQAGFTSFLNPFRTFLNIFFFHPFLRILEHITKVDQKKKKSHRCYKLLSHSSHNHWMVLGTSQNHILCGNKQNETFVLYCPLGNLPSQPCLNICKMEYDPKYDTGSQSCCCFDCRIGCGA